METQEQERKESGKLRNRLGQHDWWLGVFGNILSTVIGIILTVGVAAYVDYRNDKKQARELMFTVIANCETDRYIVERFDSMLTIQAASIDTLVQIYRQTDGFKREPLPKDTLQRCLNRVTNCQMPGFTNSSLSKSFFMGETMHQIGNANIYKAFSDCVEADRVVFEELDAFNRKGTDMVIDMAMGGMYFDAKGRDIVAENIENHRLPRYAVEARLMGLGVKVNMYKQYHKILLKAMGATEEEYREFLKNNTSAADNDSYHYEESTKFGSK